MSKLVYKTLRQEVVDEIRQKILSGEFRAGERMKENEIAESFGVSRGPVREALRQLEQEGLVKYERNIGCSVAKVSREDIYEICLLRATLEILAARLCKGKPEAEALQKMQECLERMEQAGDDVYRLAQEDNLFHAAVIEQSGFGKLEEIWKSTNVNNLAIFCAGRTASCNGAEYRQSHQSLLDSYRTGNVALIGKEIVRHYSIKSNKNIEDIFAFPQTIG